MPKCMRKGCGQDYEEKDNTSTSCHYHSGAPVFHEGLKSWSCCSDVNRPVLDFESFMAIPVRAHTQEKPKAEPPTSGGTSSISNTNSIKMDSNVNGRETYSTTLRDTTVTPSGASHTAEQVVVPQPVPVVQDEEDDLSVPVPVGTVCKRTGCGVKFVSEEASRIGEDEGAVCRYHPAPPIFREGSKGYLCCKRRVLEFEEFLKIKGCKTGKHLFVSKEPKLAEEFVSCRIDHYQTPTQVHVSIFAKQTDKDASKIRLETEKIHLDLVMPASKRFQRTLDLSGPINPTASTFMFLGTKVELVLAKADTRSWAFLEKTTHPTSGYNLTFGVGGRTGSVGGKEPILSEDNKLRSI
ncbi:HSP20-like chaperone [Gautieria morchelliformis]|nr:HSP20-like chaperone [Gautieria morchelliformis]